MSIRQFHDILGKIVAWEQGLGARYDQLIPLLRDERSRQAARLLKERLDCHLAILAAVAQHAPRDAEFIKNPPDDQSEVMLPEALDLSDDLSPQELFARVLAYEETLVRFYRHVRSVLVYTPSRELFDELIVLKTNQIKEIRALLDGLDLVL